MFSSLEQCLRRQILCTSIHISTIECSNRRLLQSTSTSKPCDATGKSRYTAEDQVSNYRQSKCRIYHTFLNRARRHPKPRFTSLKIFRHANALYRVSPMSSDDQYVAAVFPNPFSLYASAMQYSLAGDGTSHPVISTACTLC